MFLGGLSSVLDRKGHRISLFATGLIDAVSGDFHQLLVVALTACGSRALVDNSCFASLYCPRCMVSISQNLNPKSEKREIMITDRYSPRLQFPIAQVVAHMSCRDRLEQIFTS